MMHIWFGPGSLATVLFSVLNIVLFENCRMIRPSRVFSVQIQEEQVFFAQTSCRFVQIHSTRWLLPWSSRRRVPSGPRHALRRGRRRRMRSNPSSHRGHSGIKRSYQTPRRGTFVDSRRIGNSICRLRWCVSRRGGCNRQGRRGSSMRTSGRCRRRYGGIGKYRRRVLSVSPSVLTKRRRRVNSSWERERRGTAHGTSLRGISQLVLMRFIHRS